MNGTPRLRSAYPPTPFSSKKDGRGSTVAGILAPSTVQAQSGNGGEPLIPLHILDAPSQRLYISGFYIGLTAWRLYDYSNLVADQTDSLWLFMKWVAIDGFFLYGLPALKVPWLEWSSTSITILFLFHAIFDAVLMFRIPIPIEAALVALTKTMYDRELAVSERRVKPASILRNSSLILGKQIIHILPEGSAILNPEQNHFCLDSLHTTVNLPLRINQTNPILIELLRIDLDTNTNETITISSKDAKRLRRQADKEHGKQDTTLPRVMRIPIKDTGLYRLQKVVDESNLEVQRRLSDTLVVQCPSASIKPVQIDKCRGDLSNFYLQVDATPPFRIKYRKVVNREDQSSVFLTIHPGDLDSPLTRQRTSGALLRFQPEENADVSWARNQHIEVPINETLGISGGWQYQIDEIHDACGNVANYTTMDSDLSDRHAKDVTSGQIFKIHELPKAALSQCNLESPLKVAKGQKTHLPISFPSTGTREMQPTQYRVSYSFTPEPAIKIGDGDTTGSMNEVLLWSGNPGPEISEPGVYTLKSVSTEFCSGEILEPSSCLLQNPPEPDLTIVSEPIPDKCAGKSIGLLLELDLVGTPPFQVTWNTYRDGEFLRFESRRTDQMRTQLELKPSEAGQYVYEFEAIHDAVYSKTSLKQKGLTFEQDVRPPASAKFRESNLLKFSCIQESVSFEIYFTGEGPWTLEYDTLHSGKRKKSKVEGIAEHRYTLNTEIFTDGGEHLLNLASVADRSGCKTFLDQQAKVDVRHHRPEASFGRLQGKRTVVALEGKEISLPVRLTGDAPWTLQYSYRKIQGGEAAVHTARLKYANDVIKVKLPGIYEIKEIFDMTCPGTIDSSSNQFEVSWIARPTLQVADSSVVEHIGGRPIKKPVCEDDQDAMELALTGSAPYNIKYEIHGKPDRGSASLSRKKETAGLNSASIRMDTSRAGLYEYKFTEFDDQLYEHDRQKFIPLSVQQRVYSRPSASFTNIGKTYSYCKEEESGDEVIPITLMGTPPFSMEIGIRHHATSKPEIVSIPHIESSNFDFHIPHRVLALGTHGVTIRKVKDANGCRRVMDFDGPIVHVEVVDIPSISPLESNKDYCVGDRISYVLSGTPPFNVYYTFDGAQRKAASSTTIFRRIAERPGDFTITGVSDKASTDKCKARISLTNLIHELPSVRISKGRTAEVDIHEGGEAEILFEFGGTPPFEFTYTRSTNAAKGKRSVILETKKDVSHEHIKLIKASEEGTYEVVSIRDRFCGFSSQREGGNSKQQLLTFR